eukprot:4655631-Alexandrium_andersonii.AAC.1
MTNSPELAFELDRRCANEHPRAPLLGVGARSAVYAREFCQAIVKGLKRQLQLDGSIFLEIQTEMAQ